MVKAMLVQDMAAMKLPDHRALKSIQTNAAELVLVELLLGVIKVVIHHGGKIVI